MTQQLMLCSLPCMPVLVLYLQQNKQSSIWRNESCDGMTRPTSNLAVEQNAGQVAGCRAGKLYSRTEHARRLLSQNVIEIAGNKGAWVGANAGRSAEGRAQLNQQTRPLLQRRLRAGHQHKRLLTHAELPASRGGPRLGNTQFP